MKWLYLFLAIIGFVCLVVVSTSISSNNWRDSYSGEYQYDHNIESSDFLKYHVMTDTFSNDVFSKFSNICLIWSNEWKHNTPLVEWGLVSSNTLVYNNFLKVVDFICLPVNTLIKVVNCISKSFSVIIGTYYPDTSYGGGGGGFISGR